MKYDKRRSEMCFNNTTTVSVSDDPSEILLMVIISYSNVQNKSPKLLNG